MTAQVAAIIPTRNRPEFTAGAVRSALRQDYPNVSVWVVDDGSEPPLKLPAELVSDDRVHVLRPPQSLGTAAARNLAARESGADLLAFLDDDDEWFPSKTTRQVELIFGDARPAAVECGYEMRDGGELLFRYEPLQTRDFTRTLLRVPCMQPSTLMVRADAFAELGGFSLLRRIEDWDFAIRLADGYGIGVIEEALVMRRTNPNLDRAAALNEHRAMVKRLKPRIDALPPRARDSTLAYHRFVEGIFLAEVGRTSEARSAFWQAWRRDPRALSPLAHLGRTVVGERAWSALRRAGRRVEERVQRARGRDPLVRRW